MSQVKHIWIVTEVFISNKQTSYKKQTQIEPASFDRGEYYIFS